MIHDAYSIAKLRESISYIELFFAGKKRKSEQYNRAELELKNGQYNAAVKQMSDLNDYIQFASKKAQSLPSDIPRIKDIIKRLSYYKDSINSKIKHIESQQYANLENRIKAAQMSLDVVVRPKTLKEVSEYDLILKRLRSDLMEIQSDLHSAKIDIESKKSLQENVDSLKIEITEKQKINDQYRDLLKVEYYEEKVAEIKSLLDSVELDTEQNVKAACLILKQAGDILKEVKPQIRDAVIDQSDKTRLLQEVDILEKRHNNLSKLTSRLEKAYYLKNFIRKQFGLDTEAKGCTFKKLKASIFKYEDSINLIFTTIAAIVGGLGIEVPDYVKKYLEHDKKAIDYVKKYKREYYSYTVNKTSITGWLPENSSEYEYYEPILKELVEIDSVIECPGSVRCHLLFAISLSPFIIIPWMYMDRIEQIMGWFL